MDKLKEILNQKKAQIGNQKFVKVGDIEKQKAEKYYQQQQELEKKKVEKLLKQVEESEEYHKAVEKKHKKSTEEHINMLANQSKPNEASNVVEEPLEKEPPIPKKEIIKKLRARAEPITLFGETNWMRYERLLKLEKESLDHVKHDDHANIFQKDLQLNEDEFKKMIEIVDKDIPYEQLVERLEKNKKNINLNANEYKGRKKQSLSEGVSKEDKCDDILYWCKKVLKEWEKELEESGELKNTANSSSNDAKNIIGQYRQCRRHIKPLFLLLRERDVNEEILDALYHIIHYCLLKEYVKAHDKYLEIAIGNAPWPMGVTMVGIHERSGRSKIFSSQIAHILNDETQRKYLQAIKRLMTITQKQAPADYSRNVNM